MKVDAQWILVTLLLGFALGMFTESREFRKIHDMFDQDGQYHAIKYDRGVWFEVVTP